MEIERKYLVTQENIPTDYHSYPSRLIEQAYLCTAPVIRIRRDQDSYYLTYKGKGLLAREETNLALTKESFQHLLSKIDGTIIRKRRYEIPYHDRIIELDIFEGRHAPLILTEVEFDTVEQANSFIPPVWFGEDVTYNEDFSNSFLALH